MHCTLHVHGHVYHLGLHSARDGHHFIGVSTGVFAVADSPCVIALLIAVPM